MALRKPNCAQVPFPCAFRPYVQDADLSEEEADEEAGEFAKASEDVLKQRKMIKAKR